MEKIFWLNCILINVKFFLSVCVKYLDLDHKMLENPGNEILKEILSQETTDFNFQNTETLLNEFEQKFSCLKGKFEGKNI